MSIKIQQIIFLLTALLLCCSRTHAAEYVRDTGDSDQTLSYSPEFEEGESVSEEFVNSSKYMHAHSYNYCITTGYLAHVCSARKRCRLF